MGIKLSKIMTWFCSVSETYCICECLCGSRGMRMESDVLTQLGGWVELEWVELTRSL